LIDSILPGHNAHLLTIAIGLIFASYEGKAALSSLGGYFTFRATQRTALSLRISLLEHIDSLSRIISTAPRSENCCIRSRGNRRNLVLRLRPLTFHPSNRDLSRTNSIGDGVPGCTAHSCGSPDHSGISGRPPPVQKEDRTAGRFGPGHEKQISSFLQEHLSSVIQIQLLRQTERQERKASELLTNTVRSQDSLFQTGIFFSVLSNLAIVSGIVATITCGSWMVFRSKLTIGTLVAFYTLLVQLFDPLSMAMETYSRASALLRASGRFTRSWRHRQQ